MKRPDATGPLSRPINIERLRNGPGAVTVEATQAECEALAADFGIPAIRGLVGRFDISGSASRLVVTGRVEALVTQVCTVTLEPFEAAVSEPVEVEFTDPDRFAGTDAEDVEVPDPIVGGRIDFGTLTAEFLALGLDPYPRKPGVAFEEASFGEDEKPLAALRSLRREAD
ncbi:YceD family protein [Methylobacterium sp. A54F]